MATSKTMYTRIAQVALSSAQWASDTYKDIVLLAGEIGYDSTANKIKIGDGSKKWAELSWVSPDYTLPAATDSTLGGIKTGDVVSLNASDVLTIADATSAAHGLMTSSDFTKLAGISTGANKVESSATNGHIKIDGADTTVYTHATHTSHASDIYKITVDTEGHVSAATKVVKADIDGLVGVASSSVNGLMTSGDFSKLSGIASGAQVNVLEGIKFKGSGATSFTDLTIDANKKAELDLSGYALLSDISTVFNFKGTKATVADLPKSGNKVGDVWYVTATDGEYVCVDATGDGTWEELGPTIDLSGYVLKTQKVNNKALSGDITLDGSDIALSTSYIIASSAAAPAAGDKLDVAVGKLQKEIVDLGTNKADKVSSATANDFAKLDASGNLVDAGVSAADFVPMAIGSAADSGKLLVVDSTGKVDIAAASSALITSVTGTSPVSASKSGGTVTISLANAYGDTKNPYGSKAKNVVLAGPATGSDAAPSFRALVEDDIPTISESKVSGLTTDLAAKADKKVPAAAGNFAGLDASGNLTDSGKKAADFVAVAQGAGNAGKILVANASGNLAPAAVSSVAVVSVTGDTYVSATTTSGAVTLATSSKVITQDDYVLIQCTLTGIPS